MVFSVIAFSLFGMMCVWFIISGVKKMHEIKQSQALSDLYTDENEYNEALKKSADFELNYFERVRKGEHIQQFLAVGSQVSCSMIRGILAAENIPTYIENEHVNSMYSLNNLPASSAFSIKVFILLADYDRAYQIVIDFIQKCQASDAAKESASENQSSNEENTEKSDKVSSSVENPATGYFFIPLPDGSKETTMGITILPKREV